MHCHFRQVFITRASFDQTACVIVERLRPTLSRRESATTWVGWTSPDGECGVVDEARLDDGGGTRWTLTLTSKSDTGARSQRVPQRQRNCTCRLQLARHQASAHVRDDSAWLHRALISAPPTGHRGGRNPTRSPQGASCIRQWPLNSNRIGTMTGAATARPPRLAGVNRHDDCTVAIADSSSRRDPLERSTSTLSARPSTDTSTRNDTTPVTPRLAATPGYTGRGLFRSTRRRRPVATRLCPSPASSACPTPAP